MCRTTRALPWADMSLPPLGRTTRAHSMGYGPFAPNGAERTPQNGMRPSATDYSTTRRLAAGTSLSARVGALPIRCEMW